MESVRTAFELMKLELEATVENLNAEGAELFRLSRYEEANDLIAKGKALRNFCHRVDQLSDEWIENFSPDTGAEASEKEQETARTILSASKSSRTGLLVRFKDGSIICEKTAALTLAKTIERIGFERVAGLGIKVNKEDIVSRNPSTKYGEVPLNGYFIKTHSSTDQKKRTLEQISRRLNLELEVTIVLG